jgi:purine-binding chemotaxis protein CheW
MKNTNIDKKTSYINFKIGKESFAVSVYKVLEIIQFENLTRIPNTSQYVLGVLNFRGSIVPIIDMHKRFNVRKKNDDNMIIVVDIENKDNGAMMGLLVDEVTDVIEIGYKDIRSVPEIGIKYNPEFLEGIVERNEDFIMVLNTDRVLNVTELAEIEEIAENAVAEG